MEFFKSSRDKRHGKRAELLGNKIASKSNPSSPPHHPAHGRSSFSIKRSESDYAFPTSDEQTTYWKQQQPASERLVNSHHRPPVYRYSTPERRKEHGKDRIDGMCYEPEADITPRSNTSSPFRPARTRTPDRRRRSSEFSRELYERMYEVEANVSPFHPSRSRSPAPYNTLDRHRDYSRERYDESEDNLRSRNSAPSSPFHPAGSRSPSPYRRPDREVYNTKDHFEGMYEADADVTPRNSAPTSPVHRATSRSPPPPYYSSSDEDDNHSNYLFPEIATGHRSRAASGSSTPVHYKYQIVASETYEQEKQFEPPELSDESESFTMHEIAKMRALQSYGARKEEIQSVISEAYVSVANYKVRMSVSATLQVIFDKHGDIAASSKLQSISTRSYYLETLAAAVMELKSTSLRDLTKTRVAEIAAVVKDMNSVKIDVSWLKTAVKELEEAVEYFGQYDSAKLEKEVCNRDLTTGRAAMEELRDELRRREKEMTDCRERVTAMAGRLGKLEMKDSKLNKNLEMFQSKVEKFDGEAVLVEV